MSSQIFKLSDLGGTAEPEETLFWDVTVLQSASGRQERSSYQTTPRRRFVVKLPLLRSSAIVPGTAEDEITYVRNFWAAHLGTLDSFLCTVNGVQYRVRFTGNVTLKKHAEGLYSVDKLEMEEVVS